jgi:hypothetical protein
VLISGEQMKRFLTQDSEEAVPWMHVLGMNQSQPIRVQGSESHVRPYVCIHQAGCDDERYENHQESVCARDGCYQSRVRPQSLNFFFEDFQL